MREGVIRVFLVDDHEIMRRGVRGILEAEGDIEVVGEARTASAALPAILALKPDICVLDSHLPDGSGVELCREMRAANPGIKGLILTNHDDEDAVTSAILAGAAGYVLKQIQSNSLINGIRLVATGHTLIDAAIAARVVQQVQLHRRASGVLTELTPQQSKVLFLIAEGLTNRQIAERLFLSEKTVKNHVTGLLARLGVKHRTQAALLALKLRGDSDAIIPLPRRGESPVITR